MEAWDPGLSADTVYVLAERLEELKPDRGISADEDSTAAYMDMMKDSAKDGGDGIKDSDEGHLLPVGYSRPYETDLTAEVTADGENNFELNLKKDGPSPK